jgi:fatty-acyl-CoA synthase
MTRLTESYLHRGGATPLLGSTIPAHLREITSRFPDNEAVVSLPQRRRLSYAALAAEVDQLARGLLALGFARGDRIGLWSTNNIEWLVIQLASARIGAVLVNINPAYRRHELVYALQRAEAKGLFLIPCFRSSDYVQTLLAAVPELEHATPDRLECLDFPRLRHVVVFDPGDPAATQRPAAGLLTWQEVLAAGTSVSDEALDAATARLDRDDPVNIQYTSGTTGHPKAVLLTHHNILNNAWFAARALHLTPTDRLCVPVPFYHCFGMVLANLLCLSVGATIVLPSEHFDELAVLRAIEEERCTAVHGVPTMFIAELAHPRFGEFRLDSLRTGIMAGAPCPPELMKRVMRDMHCPEILIGYGQTEASPLTHLTARDDSFERRIGTVGTNLPHQEVKVVDPQGGETVPVGQPGEICFRGYHVMREYYGDAGATASAIDSAGWLHSGDLGEMDSDGYVRITGRLKEMIIRGGENIYPAEIEAFLYTHPKVAQVAVFGVPDERYGEEVMAWVQLHHGEQSCEEEIRAFCRGQIAHFKIPRHVRFVDSFPMTVTGKTQKFRMRKLAAAEMAAGTPS